MSAATLVTELPIVNEYREWLPPEIEVRRGDATVVHAIEVQSLHAITADEYIEFGEAVVHTLSYQQARHFNLPVKGVYVANPGYVFGSAGIPRAALISAFDGTHPALSLAPPISARSINATLAPNFAAARDAARPPGPAPITTRS